MLGWQLHCHPFPPQTGSAVQLPPQPVRDGVNVLSANGTDENGTRIELCQGHVLTPDGARHGRTPSAPILLATDYTGDHARSTTSPTGKKTTVICPCWATARLPQQKPITPASATRYHTPLAVSQRRVVGDSRQSRLLYVLHCPSAKGDNRSNPLMIGQLGVVVPRTRLW